MHTVTMDDVRAALLPRPRAAHKNDFGHLLIIAGSRGMAGAALIATAAALRSGARAMLIGHNHPGGSAHFSWADVNATLEIIDVLAGAGIPLLDHILVANGEGISMRASGAFDDMIWLLQGVRVPPLEQWLS